MSKKKKKALFPRKLNPYPVVLVRWIDANGDLDDFTDKDDHVQVTVVSCGFLIKDNKDGITLAMDNFYPVGDETDNSQKGRGFIPHGMIKSKTVLRK